ncbi:hypothetical protein TNIN_258521 [Trichonephila inaurata madagascariensis]|uniref:Uncharacterized protein n=1 Tax=Trichonephila inaurata madagascariensis TaxID=2747483 RepID=A0A8X6Y7Z7_9ARAC|nr:hypothetical protein TNIN_258521 [Trichonephila inaurata madagascariensis]
MPVPKQHFPECGILQLEMTNFTFAGLLPTVIFWSMFSPIRLFPPKACSIFKTVFPTTLVASRLEGGSGMTTSRRAGALEVDTQQAQLCEGMWLRTKAWLGMAIGRRVITQDVNLSLSTFFVKGMLEFFGQYPLRCFGVRDVDQTIKSFTMIADQVNANAQPLSSDEDRTH